MSKDVKFSRRDSVKHDEIENVPENLQASFMSQASNDSSSSSSYSSLSRAPLNTIPDPLTNPKESRSKIESTPSKLKAKNLDPGLPLRTPDKHRSLAAFSKNRFGWGEKCDSTANANAGSLNTTPKTGRVTGRASSCYSETNSTQNTPVKSVSKPPGSCYRTGGGGGRAGGYASLYKGLSSASGQVSTVVNTVEVPHFSLKEDPSFWMDHNVQILIRVRPLNSMEKSTNGYNRCLKQESSQCVAWTGPPETRFLFDHVACETIDQETLFRVAGLPMVENCLSGYNSCIFAYGQTGSGKTYTMLGEVSDLEVKPSPNRGMMPRIFEFLFARIQAEEESRRDERLKYNCKCSFLEIYNEQITDLLEPSSTNLQLREDIKSGVYVENLTECEVESVQDILQLITQGSMNRKVGATNMNSESSRSHSVFTCVIESRWEKDSTTNMRFARLNLVDLAGSERQKTSGAEGDRLKEAANINKSLSTLGHVIMVLVDVANGKPRHIPYRDSRLTFLLQDSLGGNSKTMIIANASPSVSCAAETLNTLKFAQRAKLIQNNAVVNEDFNGDVLDLRRQIRLLKEELSLLKRQNISRALSFGSATANFSEFQVDSPSSELQEKGHKQAGNSLVYESGGCVRMSRKQLKSLEITLAGSLRREHVADASIKKLEAEIEHLNRLVRQREEDTRSTKMMLRFREDKIQRLESLRGNHISADSFLQEENNMLSEEIKLLQAKIDKNPELTRFALENIRLLDQLRRFQEFYEEGEREILQGEVSNLRNQVFQFLDENSDWQKHPADGVEQQDALHISKENYSLQEELKKTCDELEKCRSNLGSCLEENAKLNKEIHDLQAIFSDIKASTPDEDSIGNKKKALLVNQNVDQPTLAGQQVNHVEEIIKLQLDLDVLKIILDEERTLRGDTEAQAARLKLDIGELKDQLLMMSKQQENINSELGETKSVIEALESQNITLIQEAVGLRRIEENYSELLRKQELDNPDLNSRDCNEFEDNPAKDNGIDAKFKKMQASLEKAKRLNKLFKKDIASKECGDVEMDEVHRQAEAATAEVIVCLQNELEVLQNEVNDFQSRENMTEKQVKVLETRMEELQDNLQDMNMDNEQLQEQLRGKDMELQIISNEMELLTSELEEILLNGNEGLTDACFQADLILGSLPDKRIWISEQVGGLIRTISERELMIEDLQSCLEDASKKKGDIESMLKSLRGAALVMNESHQREYEEKEKLVLFLESQLCTKEEVISKLQEKLKMAESWIYESSQCATASLVVVNRYSEVIESHTFELEKKDLQLEESARTVLSLKQQVQDVEATCEEFRSKLLDEEKNTSAMERKLEEIEDTGISAMKEKLSELKGGVSGLKSCINMCQEHEKYTEAESTLCSPTHFIEGQELGRNVVESSCIEKTPKNDHTKSMRARSNMSSERGKVIICLKQEMESALLSLKEVQFEMAKLQDEKEELKASEKKSLSNLNNLATKFHNLETVMNNMEEQYDNKMEVTDHKLKTLEHELANMKIEADQEYIENMCALKKFEEAQGIIKEADTTINELVTANQNMKFDLEEQKKRDISLVEERNAFVDKLQELESINVKENEKFASLEKLFESSLMEIGSLVQELETVVRKVQDNSYEALTGMASDLSDLKSSVSEAKSARLFLEDIWSEIIMKDCALSVLHLCHMGTLLETVTRINTENGLLQCGLRESNSSIAGLRRELEMFTALKGRLLADIKNGFERISKSEEATSLLTTKLSNFEQKFSGLQYQEKLMLQRSDSMGSQLDILMKEIDLSNGKLSETLLEKDRFFDTEVQLYLMNLCSKDVESLILELKVKECSSYIAAVDRELLDQHSIVEDLKEKLFVSQVESELKDLCLVDEKLTTVTLRQNLTEAQEEIKVLSSDFKESVQKIAKIEEENKVFGERVIFLESHVSGLEQNLATKASELNRFEHCQSVVAEELESKERDIQVYADTVSALKNENSSLKQKFVHFSEDLSKARDATRLSSFKCIHQAEDILEKLTRDSLVISDKMLQLLCENVIKASEFEDTVRSLQIDVQDLLSENLNLQDELLRKDDVLKGLSFDLSLLQESFDLSLLQESASKSRDKKDETKEIMVNVEAVEEALALKTSELEDAVSQVQILEVHLQESKEIICNLEADTEKARQWGKILSVENKEIRAEADGLLAEKTALEEELIQTKKVSESMDMELYSLKNDFGQLNDTVEFTQSKLNEAIDDRDNIQDEVLYLKEELGKMKAEARAVEVRYIEAQEMAESRKIYADEREEEVKLLEGSVEKLDYTINVLENQVNVIKGEAERQRLQREELEMELNTIHQQMESARNADEEMKRILDEKHMDLEEAHKHIEALEKRIADQKTEINQLSAHISELNLHADARGREYMHKVKELEAMAEQVKPEVHVTQAIDSSLSKGSGKPRGSGSPFRCIGLGIAQQMRSEKDEELAAARLRIEELETIVAAKQKEIFLLNSKFAKVDSMTHDINRVMLGLKQNCASLLDSQQVLKISEMLQISSSVSRERDLEVSQLKQQLNGYNEERQGWIEEIEGKQTDLVTAQIELEEHRQHEQLLKEENEFLKKENVSHKRKVMELDGEMKKLSSQQNPEWRTRDHSRIKEENNVLKLQLDELNLKLRRADVSISRAKEELTWYRASSGKNHQHSNIDKIHHLSTKLKETEEDRMQLAQKLLCLSTSILKAAGVRGEDISDINTEVAEEALEQLKTKVGFLESELQHLRLKGKAKSRRSRHSERRMPSSPRRRSWSQSPSKMSQLPFFSSNLDR